MNSPWLRLMALLMILMAIAPPQTLVSADLQFPPHDEPGVAPITVDPFSLLSYYSDLFKLISQSDYQRAKELMAQYDLAFLPDSLRSLFNSFTGQANDTQSNLQQNDQLLNQTSSLLDQNKASSSPNQSVPLHICDTEKQVKGQLPATDSLSVN